MASDVPSGAVWLCSFDLAEVRISQLGVDEACRGAVRRRSRILTPRVLEHLRRGGAVVQATPSGAPFRIEGLLEVAAGTLWNGPLTPWSDGALLQHRFLGEPLDAYTVVVTERHQFKNSQAIFSRVAENGRERRLQVSRGNMVSTPVAEEALWQQLLRDRGGRTPHSGGSGRTPHSGGRTPQRPTKAVLVARPFAEPLLSGVWDGFVWLARWPALWESYPPRTFRESAPRVGERTDNSAVSSCTLERWAQQLRSWVPAAVEAHGAQARKDLEHMVRGLQSLGGAALQRELRESGVLSSRGTRWTSEEVAVAFAVSLQTRSAEGVRECVQVLSRGLMAPELAGEAPSGPTIRKMYLPMDTAFMLLQRTRAPRVCARYVWADSSPQGGRDWLLSRSTEVESDGAPLLELMAAANTLARAVQGADAGRTAEAPTLQERQECVRLLRSSLHEHTHPPAAMGLRQTNAAHKTAAFLHSLSLEVPPEHMLRALRNVVSFTADMGTEMSIPNFHSRWKALMPAWRQQCVLRSDVAAVTSETPQLDNDGSIAAGGPCCHLQEDVGSMVRSVASSSHHKGEEQVGLPQPSAAAHPDCTELGAGSGSGLFGLLPFAISIPGMLHVCHNVLEDVDTGMSHWTIYWPQLRNLAALLGDRMRVDRFRATCLRRGPQKHRSELFRYAPPRPYSKRWGSVTRFLLRAAKQLEVLREAWDEELYGNEEEECDGSRFSPTALTATMACDLFFAYSDMVLRLHWVVEELSGWCEGCECHPPTEDERSGALRMHASERMVELGGQGPCPMQGRRAPELAGGQLGSVLAKLFDVRLSELACAHRRSLSGSEWATLCADLEHARGTMQTVLRVKLNCWEQLPWKLCGLASFDDEVVRQCALAIVNLYDNTPGPLHSTPSTDCPVSTARASRRVGGRTPALCSDGVGGGGRTPPPNTRLRDLVACMR